MSKKRKTELPVIPPIDRRTALKVMAAAAATPALLPGEAAATTETAAPQVLTQQVPGNPLAAGTAWDPDLISPVVTWERILSADELATLAVLCDVIIPGDSKSPSASQVGAHDYIDEWVSAPHSGQRRDLVVVRGGLVWLDAEASRRFSEVQRFRELSAEQQRGICEDIRHVPDAAPEFEAAARFFAKVRDLTAAAFWTTEEGMRDLEYMGNVPLDRWDPPPPDVMRHLGLD